MGGMRAECGLLSRMKFRQGREVGGISPTPSVRQAGTRSVVVGLGRSGVSRPAWRCQPIEARLGKKRRRCQSSTCTLDRTADLHAQSLRAPAAERGQTVWICVALGGKVIVDPRVAIIHDQPWSAIPLRNYPERRYMEALPVPYGRIRKDCPVALAA